MENQIKQEKAILVGVINEHQDERTITEYLDELAFLADTAGAIPVKKFTQRLDTPNSATYIGKGKVDEIKHYIIQENIDLVIFDDELSATQIRNLETAFNCRILDRTHLILDIFAKRAKTSYAKTQVALAQYQYLLPRLAGMWTHLERQRGGIGLRGPGETEIETDRRIVKTRIAKLKEELKKIDKQKNTQRSNRGKMVRVALVGYTNVGKSTLMNLISKSNIFAENKLFATLDTTVRKVVIKNLPFLLTDTVGFIRKLPHNLVESFKSTLDEVREADILLHIIDISHPSFEQQIKVVNETLMEIGVANKPIYYIFNKIDAYRTIEVDEFSLSAPSNENMNFDDFKKHWLSKSNTACIFISALKKININQLLDLIYDKVKEIHITRYPYDDFLFTINDETQKTCNDYEA